MEEETKIFEVKQYVKRMVEENSDTIIFQKKENGKWVYKAPNAQEHTESQLELILKKLKELNLS